MSLFASAPPRPSLATTQTTPSGAASARVSTDEDLVPSSLFAGGGYLMGLGSGKGVTFDTISLDTTVLTTRGPVEARPDILGRYLDGQGLGGNREKGWLEFKKPVIRFLLGGHIRRQAQVRPGAAGRGIFNRERVPNRHTLAPCITCGSAAGATYVCAARAFTALQTAEDARAGLRTHVLDIRTLYTPRGLEPERASAMVVSGLEELESLREDGFDDLGGGEDRYTWKGYSFLLI